MTENKELTVNLRNHKRGELPLSENAEAVREATLVPDPELEDAVRRKQDALARLQVRAATGDDLAADMLTVLGLWHAGDLT